MNKWLYKHWYWLYFYITFIKMAYYTFTNQRSKSIKLITEHFKYDK